MRQIRAKNKPEVVVTVDDADYEHLSQFNWTCATEHGNYYFKRYDKSNYAILMHREILGLAKGDGKTSDHINRDTLDNRRSNLRVVTVAQSLLNRGKYTYLGRSTTSQFKGVSWHKGAGAWQAKISRNGKRIWLGHFSDEKEAARAYNNAAQKIHGEYACLNDLMEEE